MDESSDKPVKSRRGGARPGAGRKKKGAVVKTALGGIDVAAALAAPVPDDITSVAQAHWVLALDALVKQCMHGASDSAKVVAANEILDRGYGKPAVDVGGDMMLPFMEKPVVGADVSQLLRGEARKFANLAIEVLRRVADGSESESARNSASKSLLLRGVGSVAPAKLPEGLSEPQRIGKREELQRAAAAAANGRYAVPAPPSARLQ
jgi:hypothetical protein